MNAPGRLNPSKSEPTRILPYVNETLNKTLLCRPYWPAATKYEG